jgi:hypothetical protein
MRGAFFSRTPPLVIDLRSCHVAMAEQFLDLADINPGIEQQGSSGGTEGMGAVEPGTFLDRSGQPGHVAGDHAVHAGLAHRFLAEFSTMNRAPCPKNWARLQTSFSEVFGQGLGARLSFARAV